MKGLQLLILATFCAFAATAQKGTTIIDADGSYDRQVFSPQSPYPQQTLQNWSLNIAAGKQLGKHFSAGISAGIGDGQFMAYRKITIPVASIPGLQWEAVKYSRLNIQLGLWSRYTYWINKRFFLYSQLSAGYQVQSTSKMSGVYAYYAPITSSPYAPSAEWPQAGITATLFPALGMNIIKGYGVHMNIGGITYTHAKVGDGSAIYSNINVNFGQQFRFGLHKIIGWKKMIAKPDTSQS